MALRLQADGADNFVLLQCTAAPVDPACAGVLRGAGSHKDARQKRLDWGGF